MSAELEAMLKQDMPVPPAFFTEQRMKDRSMEEFLRSRIEGATPELASMLAPHWSRYDDSTRIGDLSTILRYQQTDVLALPAFSETHDLFNWARLISKLPRGKRTVLNRLFHIFDVYHLHNSSNPEAGDITTFGGWRQTERGIFVAFGLHPRTENFMRDAILKQPHS